MTVNLKSNLSESEKKEMMLKYALTLETTIKKEKAYKRELENDKLTLETLEAKKTNGDAFENEVYSSYDEWIDVITKQVKVSESTLAGIEFKKVELEVINKYLGVD